MLTLSSIRFTFLFATQSLCGMCISSNQTTMAYIGLFNASLAAISPSPSHPKSPVLLISMIRLWFSNLVWINSVNYCRAYHCEFLSIHNSMFTCFSMVTRTISHLVDHYSTLNLLLLYMYNVLPLTPVNGRWIAIILFVCRNCIIILVQLPCCCGKAAKEAY